MNCRKAEELIADKALGFIDSVQELELEKHLAHCPKCRQEVEEYSLAVSALLQKDNAVQGMSELVDSVSVLAAVGSARKNSFKIIKLAVPAMAAAAVLIMIVLSPVFFLDNGTDMTTLQVLEAYAEDFDVLGMESGYADYDAEFSYDDYGVSDSLTQHLVQ